MELVDQNRNVPVDDLPDQIEVDVEVTVDDAVAQSDDLTPWDLRISAVGVCRDARGSFADDFENLENRVLVQVALLELRVREVGGEPCEPPEACR